MSKYGIGSDPEVFVTDPSGKVVPVTGLVGGTKSKPLALGDGYAVQEDGVALEYNIPVCGSVDEFLAVIKEGLRRSASKLPAGYGTVIKPDHEFEEAQLEDPSAWVSGCDPDFSAWTMAKRPGLNYTKAKKPLVRYCGGHVHISYPSPDNLNPITATYIARVADMLMGVPARWLEGDSIRAQEFGEFGIFRPKPYGLEYRTMSNIWLSIPELARWVAECSLFLSLHAPNSERLHRALYGEHEIGISTNILELQRSGTHSMALWLGALRAIGIRAPEYLCKKIEETFPVLDAANTAPYSYPND